MKTITREQLIAEIDRRQPDAPSRQWPWGTVHSYDRAMRLRDALARGEQPTTRQVVGYFGKGARFEGDDNA